MLRRKESWAKIGQAEQASAADFDVQRATLLDEAMAEPLEYEKVTEKDLAQATGCGVTRISQLLRYFRFLNFFSVNSTDVKLPITEGRFRDYWKALSDSKTMQSLIRKDDERLAYERSVFPFILQSLASGTPPPKKQAVRRRSRPGWRRWL